MTGREYMGHVAALGCVLCRRLGQGPTWAHVHHQRTGIGAGRRATDFQTIPLCPPHHTGRFGIHGLGRKSFEAIYGVSELELVEQTRREVDARLRTV